MDRNLSAASLTSENAKSTELLTSLGQLNHMEITDNDIQIPTEEKLPIREKLNKKFGMISLTQRNLTQEEATTKPSLVKIG